MSDAKLENRLKTYYAETGIGCTLVEAESEERALHLLLIDVGLCSSVSRIRVATEKDIAWVKSMREGVNPK